MKIRNIVLMALCLGVVAPAMAQNQIDKKGRKQGHWIRTDKNGVKIYEGDFKDNLEVDTFTYFYPDGTMRLRNVYTTPGKYCKHEAFDEKGNLIASGFYNQKNRDGEWRLYAEGGRLVKIASYKMGIREGLQVIFNSNGDTAEVSTFVDNHRNGRWWKRVGKQGYITGTFVKGNLEGKLVEYAENGKMIREGYYHNGEKHGSYKYYEEGVLTVDESWQDGTLLDRKILLTTPSAQYVSTFGIAYFYPKGTSRSILYKNDGTVLTCQEDVETIFRRVGSEQFVTIDHKGRVVANQSSVMGIAKDAEGRDIVDLMPKPATFSVYPDEDCIKMIKALRRIDELDQ